MFLGRLWAFLAERTVGRLSAKSSRARGTARACPQADRADRPGQPSCQSRSISELPWSPASCAMSSIRSSSRSSSTTERSGCFSSKGLEGSTMATSCHRKARTTSRWRCSHSQVLRRTRNIARCLPRTQRAKLRSSMRRTLAASSAMNAAFSGLYSNERLRLAGRPHAACSRAMVTNARQRPSAGTPSPARPDSAGPPRRSAARS